MFFVGLLVASCKAVLVGELCESLPVVTRLTVYRRTQVWQSRASNGTCSGSIYQNWIKLSGNTPWVHGQVSVWSACLLLSPLWSTDGGLVFSHDEKIGISMIGGRRQGQMDGPESKIAALTRNDLDMSHRAYMLP